MMWRDPRVPDPVLMGMSRGWLAVVSRPDDERGATAVEWAMIVALVVAALVLVAALGAGWAGGA
jgi:hypothetical protein